MTYKDLGFRGVYHRFLVIDMNETVKNLCKDFPCFEKANCALVYGYIDHTAGTTLEVLACGHRNGNNYEFYDSPTDKRCFIRIGAVESEQLFEVDNNDELFKRYGNRLEILKEYIADECLIKTRGMEFLDPSRHEHYPDDIQLYLKTLEDDIEVCWLRIEGADDKTLYGTLLNEPYKKCACHSGDLIEFSLIKTDDGRIVCVSDGNKREREPANETLLKSALNRFNEEQTDDNLIAIVELLRDILIWIPCNAVISDDDIAKLKDAKVGMTFENTDNIRMIPDILQNGDNYFFPVFTSCEEMGEYGDNFSKIEKWFLEAIPLAFNNEKSVTGIVINAFTDAFVVPNDLLEIIRKQGSHFSVEEQ